MKPPKTLTVGAYRYKFIEDVSIAGENVGEHLPMEQLIKLVPGQAPDFERDTVLHEVLHACIHKTCLSEMEVWGKNHEEAIVVALTPILLDTLRRNPKLVQYLTEP